MKRKRVVLDSSALVAYLQREPRGEAVKHLLTQARRRGVGVYISAVNLGEALYILAQKRGADAIEQFVRWMVQVPMTVLAAEKNDAIAAALLKINHRVPYADCFVAALAQRLNGEVLTSDRHFEAVQHIVPVRWI